MKVGDLVQSVWDGAPLGNEPANVGIVVDILHKKVWRTDIQGKKVNWGSIDPEEHAVVSWSIDRSLSTIPTKDLEVYSEAR